MNKLDRYILRQLVSTVLFSLAGLCVLFVVVHLLENLDGFLDKKTPARVIGLFYLNYLPEIVKLITPVSMLLASLFTIGRLANTSEITAMKAGGMSVYRIMAPLVFFGALLAAGQIYFNGWIVPKANQHKAEIERKFLQKGRLETSLYNVYLRDTPTRNALIRFYDDLSKTGNYLTIEEYSAGAKPRLVRRLDATSFSYDTTTSKWRLHNGMEHTFEPTAQGAASDPAALSARAFSSYDAALGVTPNELFQLQRGSGELTFPELRASIALSQRGGKDVRKQLIDYYGEYALPFANIIVTLFGVIPLAARRRKSGLALEIASAMVIAFLYMAFIKVSQTLAYATALPPVLGAWLANGVFACVGFGVLLKMRI